jgi:hypothetical protein
MSDSNNNINNNLPPTAAVIAVIPPGSEERADTVGNKKPRGWTTEQNIALLEEVGNFGAHIPAPRQTKKCWENVTEALKSRGNANNNYRTIQNQFMELKAKFLAERAKKEATAGVEDFGDDDDPVAQLMEDLLEEVKDFEAEKAQMTDEKRNKEASLVAGGKILREKTANQILAGETVAIGGSEPTLLRRSPASSVSDVDLTSEPSTNSSKKRQARDRFFGEFDLMEHESKKFDLEVKKFDLESKRFDAELELKRAEQEQAMVLHREAMELKKREIDVQQQSLQLQLTQHQEEMRLRFLEFEQRLKK